MRFCPKRMGKQKTIHFRYSALTMMARAVQTHIRTTLGAIISDGVPLLRHAHVSNALCNRNVHKMSWAAQMREGAQAEPLLSRGRGNTGEDTREAMAQTSTVKEESG